MKYFKVSDSIKLEKVIEDVTRYPDAVICEVICLRNQKIVPSVASHHQKDGTMVFGLLEDTSPFLGREEFKKEMIVKPVED